MRRRRAAGRGLLAGVAAAAIPALGFSLGFGAALADSGSAPPPVRVGLAIDVPRVVVSSPAPVRVHDAESGAELRAAAGPGRWTVEATAAGGAQAVGTAGDGPTLAGAVLRFEPAPEAPLFVAGTPYRGVVELRAGPGGITAVNELSLEDYLLGVVPLEIGPRTPDEEAAVRAQAVAARTYAVSRLGTRPELGFDLYGSVEDQVYGGIPAERPEATRAVRATEGVILLYGGRPIRAYYHSTCGGRTAPVEEVLDRPGAPYLRAVEDRAPDGTDWCAISPRYRWESRWTRERLSGAAAAYLVGRFGPAAEGLGPIRGVRVLERTESARVRELAFTGPGLELPVSRLEIRRALADSAGRILGSTWFDVERAADGAVVLHGRGWGHGAGMCQWGAIGRARAGQGHEEILRAYYPGARLAYVYGGEGS